MKIGHKLTGTFLIFTLAMTSIFYWIGVQNQNKNFKQIALEQIRGAEASFRNFKEQDTKMLLSSLEVITQDPRLKEIYLEKNRQRLFDYVQPLFRNLKNKYGITQFYFILPDGRVFLRIHEKDIHGDLIKRTSFQKARDTKNPTSEFEIGKTAFSLRAVMPYYDAGTLIGYVELGEEIGHFLEILKGGTRSEFGIIADKPYFNRDDWKIMRAAAGLRDNWDDLRRHLVLSSTAAGEIAGKCFAEDNLERMEKGENVFQRLKDNNRTFMCGGFDLKDAGGRHIGGVLALTDIADHVAAAQKAKKRMLSSMIVFFFLTCAAGVFISRRITKPILKLAEVAKAVGRGDLDRRISTSSDDEIGQLGGIFNDMIRKRKEEEAERKRLEGEREKLILELQDTLAKVSRSQKEWQYTFDSITDLISIHDNDYNIIKANKSMAANFGLHPREMIGRKCYEFYHGSDLPDAGCSERARAEDGGPSAWEVHVPKTGRVFRLSTFPYYSPEGKELIGSIYIARDITEEKEKEGRLAISEKLAALGHLASGVAHEVRNPLNALLSVTEALTQELKGERDIDEYLFHIRVQIKRLSSLMNDLLDLGKPIEPSRLRIESLTEMCSAAVDLWKHSALSKDCNVSLIQLPRTDNIAVMADSQRVQQVLLNLLDNAAQHSPKRSEIRIIINEPQAKTVKIQVVDQGSGIPEDILSKVFEPFFSTRREGTGLGLSIVRNIIQQHGGTIELKNNTSAIGCTVELSLPIAGESGP